MDSIQSKVKLVESVSHQDSSVIIPWKGAPKSYVWKRYQWQTIFEFITFAFSYSISSLHMLSLVQKNTHATAPSLLHYTVLYIFVGAPLVYMETVLGRYSQLCTMAFSRIAPIGHGIGYTVVIISLLACFVESNTLGDLLLYFLSSAASKLPWMQCTEDTTGLCWGEHEMKNCITAPCLNGSSIMSSFLFWRQSVMENVDVDPKALTFGFPIVRRAIFQCIIWIAIFVCTYLTALKMKMFLVVCKVCAIAILIIFIIFIVIISSVDSSLEGIKLLIRVDAESLYNETAWIFAMSHILNMLKLADILYLMLGSYMHQDISVETAVIVHCTVNYLTIITFSLLTYTSMGLMVEVGQTTVDQLPHMTYLTTEVILTYTPQALGYLGVPQILNLLYFGINFVNQLLSCVTTMYLVETNITEMHGTARFYRSYIIGFMCLVGCLVCVVFVSKEGIIIVETVRGWIPLYTRAIVVALETTIVLWIYGVQKLSDDIHFMTGQQPAKFWKVCWILLPLIYIAITLWSFMISFANNSALLQLDRKIIFYFNLFTVLLVIFPIIIGAVYKLFVYIKLQNMVGLLRPEERWGPRDPEERRLRRLFNPREEIKSRRRNTTCEHSFQSSLLNVDDSYNFSERNDIHFGL